MINSNGIVIFTSPKPRNDQTEAVQIAAFRSWRRVFRGDYPESRCVFEKNTRYHILVIN